MQSTLFIAGNPYAKNSQFLALAEAELRTRGLQWISLAEEHGPNGFDIPKHQSTLEEADTIVMHFPMYWYSSPALVKSWLDALLTPGWAFPLEVSKLRGKRMLLSVTTGSPLDTFQPTGSNERTLEDLLLPFERMAKYCGMNWLGVVASQWNTEKANAEVLKATAHSHTKAILDRINAPA